MPRKQATHDMRGVEGVHGSWVQIGSLDFDGSARINAQNCLDEMMEEVEEWKVQTTSLGALDRMGDAEEVDDEDERGWVTKEGVESDVGADFVYESHEPVVQIRR